MTLVASIEHRFTSRRVFNEAFVTLHNFLSSTCAPLGVTRIAYNTGSNPSGLGIGFHDSTNSASNNAWAVFQHASGSTPFYTLIQYTEQPFLGVTGSSAFADGSTAVNYCLAVATAFREDGGMAWNGTTASNGTDVKGNPVWASGSSRLHMFPRSNNATGSHATVMNNMHAYFRGNPYSQNDLFNLTEGGTGAVSHYFADENNFLFMTDVGAMGNFSAVFFGRYLPRTDISASYPYMMAGWFVSSADQNPFRISTIYGHTGGGLFTNGFAGGAVHPSSSYGVRSYSMTLHELFHQSRFHPNRSIITASNRYDEHRPMMVMSEGPNHYGYIGSTPDFFRIGWGIPTGAVSSSGDWAAFNLSFAFGLNRPWNTYSKIIVPWTGSIRPYSLTSRLGTQFTRSML